MPYVRPADRVRLDDNGVPQNAGELNYCITWHLLHTDTDDIGTAVEQEVENFLTARRLRSDRLFNNYQDYNDVLGALTGAEAEYRRRRGVSTRDDLDRCLAVSLALCRFYDNVVAPYEDVKIRENGDVYR